MDGAIGMGGPKRRCEAASTGYLSRIVRIDSPRNALSPISLLHSLEKAIDSCIAKLLAEVRDIRDGYVRKVLEILPGNRAPEGKTTAGMQPPELIP